MPSHAALFKRTAVAAALAAAFPGMTLAAGVARVDFAIGNVAAVAPDGRSRPLARGSEIDVGETVTTRQGRAQLRFTDGARMSLQPGTEFKVDEYRYSGKPDGEENVVMSLLKGGMRTITGLIGRFNRDRYTLRTEVATIGIRGTEYSVSYTNSINVWCANGSIAVVNDAGTLILNSGEGGYVSNINTQPNKVEERPFLPPQETTQQDIDPPVNPLQDSQPGTTLLTGTISGNYAYSQYLLGTGAGTTNDISLDASGRLVSFTDVYEGTTFTKVGGATPQSAGNDGIIAWGRWVNGQMERDGSSVDLAAYGPFHYVVGLPAGTLPSGTASYDMIGASGSCMGANCTSLVVNSSSLSVNFDAGSVGMDLKLTVNGDYAGTYSFSSSLGYGSPGNLNGAIINSIYAPDASGNASLYAQGFLAGAGAVRAGLGWNGYIYGESSTYLNGVTAYTKK